MSSKSADPAWLPDHQLHVAMTLAHADSCIQRLGDVLHDYLMPGPLELVNVPDGHLCHVTVAGISPLPAAVSRLAADAMVNLRAAIEHAVFAEVEMRLGRTLAAEEARRVEMPAAATAADFDGWLKGRKRPLLSPLAEGSELVERLQALQPYQRRDADNHPLRVLAEHTNHAKHRTPAVAAVRLGQVNTWPLGDPEIVVSASGATLEAGTVLATGPRYRQVPLDIWPAVAIQRPHSGEWKVVIPELAYMEEWVRTIAIPLIITGGKQEPALPPFIDITKGWKTAREAIASGMDEPAAKRSLKRIQAHGARIGLVDTLAQHPEGIERRLIEHWVASLTDEEILTEMDALAVAARGGPLDIAAACLRMIKKAQSVDEERSLA